MMIYVPICVMKMGRKQHEIIDYTCISTNFPDYVHGSCFLGLIWIFELEPNSTTYLRIVADQLHRIMLMVVTSKRQCCVPRCLYCAVAFTGTRGRLKLAYLAPANVRPQSNISICRTKLKLSPSNWTVQLMRHGGVLASLSNIQWSQSPKY